MVSSSLMGNIGRYSRLAGFGNIGAAMSGFQYIVGWPDRPPIGPFGPYTDYVAPRLALVVLLAALEDRERHRSGLLPRRVTGRVRGVVPGPRDGGLRRRRQWCRGAAATATPSYVPHGVFPCRADGPGRADHVAIAVRDDRDFAALAGCHGPARSWRTDPRYATATAGAARRRPTRGDGGEWTRALTASEIEEACQAAGVPAHRASTSADFVTDPQLAHRGHLIRLPHRSTERSWSRAPLPPVGHPRLGVKAAPTIGEDNVRVLAGISGSGTGADTGSGSKIGALR